MPAKSKNKREAWDPELVQCWELRCSLDDNKMHAYEQFIKENVKDKVVIDLGTGPGIMGYLAIKYGAKKVYCIELIEKYLNVAKKMLADYDNVEFILGDARNLTFPEADIIIHEIFGHNVYDEYIYDISKNLHKQGMLHKITPRKIEWLRYEGKYSGPAPEHKLYVKEDFPEGTQEFHQLYIKRVENFIESQMKYEPYFDSEDSYELESLGTTDLTHIDTMQTVPSSLNNLDNYVLGRHTELYGWHAYMDDNIYYSNILRPCNNWSPMPGGRQHWERFKNDVTFGTNKNPYTRGIKCPFSK